MLRLYLAYEPKKDKGKEIFPNQIHKIFKDIIGQN
jgi:hypothetical protein